MKYFINFINEYIFIENIRYNDIIYNGEFDRVPNIGEQVRICQKDLNKYYNVIRVLNDVKSRGTEEENDPNFQPAGPIHYYVYLKEII